MVRDKTTGNRRMLAIDVAKEDMVAALATEHADARVRRAGIDGALNRVDEVAAHQSVLRSWAGVVCLGFAH
jgi:hypothetical protein